ncbi:MAG: hypothetical protein QW315_04290 [Candidatus Hadarchaeum sp.]
MVQSENEIEMKLRRKMKRDKRRAVYRRASRKGAKFIAPKK